MALGCAGLLIYNVLLVYKSHSTDNFDGRALQSAFDSKIQPSHNETKPASFFLLCGLGAKSAIWRILLSGWSSYEQNSKQDSIEDYIIDL